MTVAETGLYLVRHGRLVNSLGGVLNGMRDTALTDEGLRETVAWADAFPPGFFSVVVSSDLSRTAVPAAMMAGRLGCGHEQYVDLREINAGRWEGRTYPELMAEEPDYLDRRLKDPVRVPFPGGEHLSSLRRRVRRRFDELLSARAGTNVLVVTHAGVVRSAVLTYLGLPLRRFFTLEVDFASLTILRFFDDGNVTLKGLNLAPGEHP